MMRSILAGVITLICFAAAVPATAAEPAPLDPDRVRLATQVVEAIGGEATMRAQLEVMFAATSKMMRETMPAGRRDLSDALLKYVADEQLKQIPALLRDMVEVYASTLTEEELRDLLAWQTSPSGRSISAKAPLVAQAIIARQTPRVRAMQAGIAAVVIDKVCVEAKCTPADREALTSAVRKAMGLSAT